MLTLPQNNYFIQVDDELAWSSSIGDEDGPEGTVGWFTAQKSWGDDVSKYKGKDRYQEVLLEYLDQKHREQVEAGLDVEKEDEVRTYPF